MAYGSPFILTAETDQGPATYQDTYDSTLPNKGARNPLGSRWVYQDSSNRNVVLAFVRVNATVAPGTLYCGPVYWKDNTFTVVTPVFTEGFNSANMVAGVLVNTGITNGNFTWIIVSGYCGASSDTGWGAAIQSAGSVAIGDGVIGATGSSQAVARQTAGTPTYKLLYYALTAVASNVSDGLVCCEFYGTN